MTTDRELLGDPCPSWCKGTHEGQSRHRQDRCHESALRVAEVRSSRGVEVTVQAELAQYPFAEISTREVYATLFWDFNDRGLNPALLREIANGAEALPAFFRKLAEELDEAIAEDRQRRSP